MEWEFEKEDLDFLRDVGKMEISLVAQKWAKRKGWEIEKAEANTRGWMGRIRKRVSRCQHYVNNIRVLQKLSPRIRKFTTSGGLQNDKETEEDEED